MNRPVWPQRRRLPKIRMTSIAAGTDPGTDHPVPVIMVGVGMIVLYVADTPCNGLSMVGALAMMVGMVKTVLLMEI